MTTSSTPPDRSSTTVDSTDALWDPSAATDPFITSLEERLTPLRHQGNPPVALASRPRRTLALAASIALVTVIGIAWYASHRHTPALGVEVIAGAPSVGGDSIASAAGLREGQWITTGSDDEARINIGTIGHVNVRPGSRLRLLRTAPDAQHLELARGEISAMITAPPRLFQVDTPHARAVDLGCIYDLRVADDGSTELRVNSGLVELAGKGRLSRVPGHAFCRSDPVDGPGLPYFEDEDAGWIAEVRRYEETGSPDALASVLRSTSKGAALTLYHMIERADQDQREPLIKAAAALIAAPENCPIERLVQLDKDAMDAWWELMLRVW